MATQFSSLPTDTPGLLNLPRLALVSQGAGIRLVTEQAQMCRFYRYCYDFSPTDCTVLGRVGSQRTAPLQCCAVPEQTLGLGELISLLVSLS